MSDLPARSGIKPIVWVIAFVAAALLIGLAYVSLKNTRPATPAVPLEKFALVPEFTLNDQTGATLGSADLKGKIWVANFIFTRCKGAQHTFIARQMGHDAQFNLRIICRHNHVARCCNEGFTYTSPLGSTHRDIL